jgi:hypothetical protein
MCWEGAEFLGIPGHAGDVSDVFHLLEWKVRLTGVGSVYQQYMERTLVEKYKMLDLRLEKTVNDANAEMASLQDRVKGESKLTR